MILKCTSCGTEHRLDHQGRCGCGGMVDALYDLDKVKNFIDHSKRGIWRYWRLLPVDSHSFSSFDGDVTPLYRSTGLGQVLGLENLWIKDESKNPTRTFKYREAVVTLNRYATLGVKEIVLCSTGNTAAAFSYVASRLGSINVNVLIPLAAKARMDFPIPPMVKAAYIDGDYHDICDLAPNFASANSFLWEGGFSNFCRREGLKTLAFEVTEQGLQPDWYVQAVGSGVGPCGVFKGFSELLKLGVVEKIPRVLCVQPETCSPMVRAFKDGREELPIDYVVKSPKTCATSLIQGRPSFSYPYVRRAVISSKGSMESVSEEAIKKAQGLVERYEGLSCEPSSATAVAGLMKCIEGGLVEKSDVILLNHSGGLRGGVPADLKVFSPHTPLRQIYLEMGQSTNGKVP